MADYHFDFRGATIDHGSCGIHTFCAGSAQGTADQTLLRELGEIRDKLERTEPLLASAVSGLERAVREQDQPQIKKLSAQLSTGFAASTLANLASGALLAFLGIG